MAFELKNNQFILSRNRDKKEDRQPDMRGSAMLDGVEYEIAGWTKESRDGQSKYLLGQMKPKQARRDNGDGFP